MKFSDKLKKAITVPTIKNLEDYAVVKEKDIIEFRDGSTRPVSYFDFKGDVTVRLIKKWGVDSIKRIYGVR